MNVIIVYNNIHNSCILTRLLYIVRVHAKQREIAPRVLEHDILLEHKCSPAPNMIAMSVLATPVITIATYSLSYTLFMCPEALLKMHSYCIVSTCPEIVCLVLLSPASVLLFSVCLRLSPYKPHASHWPWAMPFLTFPSGSANTHTNK